MLLQCSIHGDVLLCWCVAVYCVVRARLDEQKRVWQSAKALQAKEAPLKKWSSIFESDWLQNSVRTLEEADASYLELTAQADAMLGDETAVSRYAAEEDELQALTLASEQNRNRRESQLAEIKSIRSEWYPKLKSAVTKIGDTFVQKMSAINCKGTVRLDTGRAARGSGGSGSGSGADGSSAAAAAAASVDADSKDGDDSMAVAAAAEEDDWTGHDFAQYQLIISVSYRGSARLKALSSTSQSGGERSVATMLYLLCLQNVTECPFRVVDEINQGMDPINERAIFNLITQSSEQRSDAPQYFLVTPKLLPNLVFTKSMSILIVCNGPWQQIDHYPTAENGKSNPRLWNFDAGIADVKRRGPVPAPPPPRR